VEKELSSKAVVWIQYLAKEAVKGALMTGSEFITEGVCKELFEKCLIVPTTGNDGDMPWDGKMELSSDLATRIYAALNVGKVVQEMFSPSDVRYIEVSRETLEKIRSGTPPRIMTVADRIWLEALEEGESE